MSTIKQIALDKKKQKHQQQQQNVVLSITTPLCNKRSSTTCLSTKNISTVIITICLCCCCASFYYLPLLLLVMNRDDPYLNRSNEDKSNLVAVPGQNNNTLMMKDNNNQNGKDNSIIEHRDVTGNQIINEDDNNEMNACQRLNTIRDVYDCYNNKGFLRQQLLNNCSILKNNITSYHDLIYCGIINRHYTSWGRTITQIQQMKLKDNNNKPIYPKRITHINIIGERHSGTKFLKDEIDYCFSSTKRRTLLSNGTFIKKNITTINDEEELQQQQSSLQYNISNIKIQRDFLRSKHWFQPIRYTSDYRETLLIIIVRNPIDWMMAMWQNPYHSPYHIHGFDNITQLPIPLSSWKDFVNTPWSIPQYTKDTNTIIQSEFDFLYLMNLTSIKTSIQLRQRMIRDPICRFHFAFNQIIPCRYDFEINPFRIPNDSFRGYEPVYELKQQRLPQKQPFYNHLLQLRSDKIINWLIEVPMILMLGGVVLVRYEDLVVNGTEFILKQIGKILYDNQYDVEALDNIDPHQEGDSRNNKAKKTLEEIELPSFCIPTPPQHDRIKNKRFVPHDYRDWIVQNANKDTERLLGYDI